MENRLRTSLSAVSLLRAMIPPWHSLNDPLVQYEIRRGLRAGRRSWGTLVILYLTMLAEIFFLTERLLSEDLRTGNQPFTNEVLPGVGGILMSGLVLLVMLGHWRLILAISARAGNMIAGRRQRGEWDLIAITPMPKARWFRAQLTILGWQVFPLVRELIITQAVLVVLGFGYLISIHRDETPFYSQDQLSTELYILAILPVGVLLALWVVVEMGMFAMIAMLTSSYSKRITMSILYSFLGVFISRLVLTTVLYYGGVLVLMLVAFGMNLTGLEDIEVGSSDLELSILLVAVMYCCMAIPVNAFFLEWMPALMPMALMTSSENSGHVAIYLTFMLTGILTYIIAPFIMIGWLARRTIARLEKAE